MEVLELPESQICCGSAGIYNLVQPETAEQLADRKASHIASMQLDTVATANPGCLLQLDAALKRQGKEVAIVHVVELLDRSIQGAGGIKDP
jgi:glycolate oxidase iron-sulfur subunit